MEIPRLHELTGLLEQGGTEAACARIDLARSQPLRLSDRALLDALSSALSCHQQDLAVRELYMSLQREEVSRDRDEAAQTP